ncbi:MAG: AmmeMemoRadiSam system protein B [Elusimicrobiota bacterium]|nr:AmmeMemoRadiSam system protein B [Elusimicrobiota bacterium]
MPAVEDGQQLFVLRDLEELSDKPLALSAGGMLLISLLDGRRTAAQLAAEFHKNTGNEVDQAVILELVNALDAADYLETPAVADKRRKARDDFKLGKTRPAVFAGPSYPAEPAALTRALDGYLQAEGGPKKPTAKAAAAPPPLGLVAPHIDFGRGGHAYGWAYQALSERKAPDVIVALGVAHVSPDSPWIFTPKPYETPFGAMEVDGALYDALASKLWYDPRADEWVHKMEHSLEFQATWLRWLYGDKTPRWVPILVSSFERFSPDGAPSRIPTVSKALDDMAAALAEEASNGRTVMVLNGIDLAHVGPRFGDELEPTPELASRIEGEDRASLVSALAHDADAFYASCVDGDGWRKVCGLSTLYTGLRLMKGLSGGKAGPGRLLAYGQAPDPAGGIVSFASAVYDR